MAALIVVTPAPRRGMTTPERYREAMLPPDADFDELTLDAQIEILIGQATARAEAYCNRIFAQERVIETIYTQGEFVLFLTRLPVVEVHSVTINGELAPTERWILEDPSAGVLHLGYSAVGRAAFYQALGSGSYGWPTAAPVRATIAVEYTGGWIMPGGTGADFPADLEGAAQMMVRELNERVGMTRLDIVSEKLGDASWTYETPKSGGSSSSGGASGSGAFGTLVTPILDRYRISPL
jgi:hypothetical protein